MQKTILFALVVLFSVSCEKEGFNLNNPNVSKFVSQIKSGTYSQVYVNEEGESVWALMPEFTMEHVPQLIEYANDTTHLTDLSCIPLNPKSSRMPIPHDRDYMILGEYLLWCAQGVISGGGEFEFPSLDPYLVKPELIIGPGPWTEPTGLMGEEILDVCGLYLDWWTEYGAEGEADGVQPLDETIYSWF
jgi:hypothetical protein